MLVLERKERAVRKDAHTEPGAIGNSHQAKIAVMRCCEPADIGGAHRLLLICRPPADKERDRPQLSTQTRARLSRLPTDKVIVSSERARRFGFVQKQVRWQTNI